MAVTHTHTRMYAYKQTRMGSETTNGDRNEAKEIRIRRRSSPLIRDMVGEAEDGSERRQTAMNDVDVLDGNELDGEHTGRPGLIRCSGEMQPTTTVLLEVFPGGEVTP